MVPNLDHEFTADDLFVWGNKYQRATKAQRVELFGKTGAGTVTAARNLANYASNKGAAMHCRHRGDMSAALLYEGICERIYSTLPDYARW